MRVKELDLEFIKRRKTKRYICKTIVEFSKLKNFAIKQDSNNWTNLVRKYSEHIKYFEDGPAIVIEERKIVVYNNILK